MDMIEHLNLGTAAELGISAAIILAVVQAIKRTKIDNKWLPWLAMVFGILAGLVSVSVTNSSNWASAAVMGFLVGAATSGLFDGVKSASTAVTDRKNKVADLQDTVNTLTAELEKLKTADKSQTVKPADTSVAPSSAAPAESQEAK